MPSSSPYLEEDLKEALRILREVVNFASRMPWTGLADDALGKHIVCSAHSLLERAS